MIHYFQSDRVEEALRACRKFTEILSGRPQDEFRCPYDGITMSTDERLTEDFLNLVLPACYFSMSQSTEKRYYKYVLKCSYFVIQWEPIYKDSPYTIIRMNPNTSRFTPDQVLALLDYLVGSHCSVYVISHDDKVDITGASLNGLIRCVYVQYVKKPPRKFMNTYYIGSNRSQYYRIYDKALHLGLSEQLIRIERRIKYKRSERLSVQDFLYSPRADVFQSIILVDTGGFPRDSKIVRRIQKHGTFMNAYLSLSKLERRKLRKQEAFHRSVISLYDLFQADLQAWIASKS